MRRIRAASVIALFTLSCPQLFGVAFQVVPFTAIGGPEEGLHFQTKMIFIRKTFGTASGTIALFDDESNRIPAFFNGQGPFNVFEIRGLDEVIITSRSAQVQTPKASLDNVPVDDMVVLVQIQLFQGKTLLSEVEQRAVVPAALAGIEDPRDAFVPALRGAAIPFDARGNKSVGVAILNPTQGAAQVTLRLKADGSPQAAERRTILAGRRLIGTLHDFFGSLVEGRTGSFEIQADRPILVVGIQIDFPKMRALPVFPLSLANRIVVDALRGDDAGDGTSDKPLRTLTRAFKLANSLLTENAWVFTGFRLTIHASGTFTGSGGESFPLLLPDKVDLESATIEGGGNFSGANVAVVLTQGAAGLRRCSIRNPNREGVAVLVSGGNLGIQESKVTGSAVGVRVAIGSDEGGVGLNSSLIFGNQIGLQLHGNSGVGAIRSAFLNNDTGIEFRDQAGGVLEHNTISANKVGIALFNAAKPVMGNSNSTGLNVIRGNSTADICHQGSSTVSAKNNIWDNNPPSRSAACAAGIDIGGPGANQIAIN